MLTENRKRRHSGAENGHLVPQAKRPSGAHPLSPEPGRDAWDCEPSSSESSINSLDHGSCSSRCAMAPCSPLSSSSSHPQLAAVTDPVTYVHINRILKQAHFQSLQCRGHLRDT